MSTTGSIRTGLIWGVILGTGILLYFASFSDKPTVFWRYVCDNGYETEWLNSVGYDNNTIYYDLTRYHVPEGVSCTKEKSKTN